MGNKLQTIHYTRLINDIATEGCVQRRRDECRANIQLRIMRKLVNFVSEFHADDMDDVLRTIECLPSDWRELVETLNVE